MVERRLDAGTIAANTPAGYDLVTLADGNDIRKLRVTNSSTDTLTLNANGTTLKIYGGSVAELDTPSRIQEFTLTSGAAGITTNQVQIICLGDPLTYPYRGY